MSAPAVFSRRAMLGWVAAVVAVFALAICLLAFGSSAPQGKSVGPSAYSHSAIGYAGLAELIHRTGITVVKARYGGVDGGATGKLVVLTDPAILSTAGQDSQGRYAFGNAERVLVILPKWYGYINSRHSGWISEASLRPIGLGDEIIKRAGATGKMARVERPGNWTTNALGIAPELTSTVQVIADTKLRPVVAAGGQVLVGEQVDRNQRIWIVSDPDMLSNHGLFSGRNAEFAIALINALRPARGDVVFSEWTAGNAVPSANPANPLTMLLQFPFIVVTMQLLAASAFLLWAAMPRFGLAVPAPEMLAAGKQRLIQNAAALLRYSSHPEIIVASYVRLSVRSVARELRSPRGLDWRRLMEWLTRIGASRGVSVDLPGLVRRAEDLATSRPGSARTLVEIVHNTYRWKREILNGP
jgi:hypothetical protein